jgi:hypothetical protein
VELAGAEPKRKEEEGTDLATLVAHGADGDRGKK